MPILKVLTRDEASNWRHLPKEQRLLWMPHADDLSDLFDGEWAGVVTPGPLPEGVPSGLISVTDIRTASVIAPGDVVRLAEGRSLVSVLFRRGSNSNTLLATERCNSLCLMCSQPPRDVDDRWLAEEGLRVIPLVDPDAPALGISGGEPTLLGDDLVLLIYQAKRYLPKTELDILSNGRRFADSRYAQAVSAVSHPRLRWAIPIYSQLPETHDYIVQAPGAWFETLTGLYNLARNRASIEIRIVVQKSNFARLGELAYFIFRNLSFVEHIAFMGLEPTGFARRNHDDLWIDPQDCADALADAVYFLANRGMAVSIYNFPLCQVPRSLWPFCRKSISDWKNIYLPGCKGCEARNQCCGFFRSVGPGWIGRSFGPLKSIDALPPDNRSMGASL